MSEQLDVIYITLNEAHHLRASIESLRGLPVKVYVVDSGSSDGTVDVALEMGAYIVQRPFRSFGDQWNFALIQLPLKAPWTMKLDPDERVSPELRDEFARVMDAPDPSCEGYAMPRRLWFMGRPLHVTQDVVRLWKRGACRFSDVLVNEHPQIKGTVGRLSGRLEHLDSPDLHHWIEKQNQYSTLEAISRFRGDAMAAHPRLSGTPMERRMFFKRWFFSMPFRYPLHTLYLLIMQGAWRDGRVGLAWARLRTEAYCRLTDFKMMEMRYAGHLIEPAKPTTAIRFDGRVPFFE